MRRLYLISALILTIIASYGQTAEFDPNDIAILKAIRDNAPADSPLKTAWADESQISTWAGVTWNNSVPAKVTDLDFDSQKLTTLDVKGLSKLQTLWCPYNQLSSLDLSGLADLEALECINNHLTFLNVSGLTKLDFIRCENNQLTSLDVSSLTSLSTLNCGNNQLSSLDVSGLTNISYMETEDNKIPFSHLPLPNSSFTSYLYSPQNKVFEAKKITVGQEIDYSTEALIDGATTVFTWYKDGTEIAGTDQTGKYTPIEAGDYYCKMTNAKFPGLTLISNTVTVMVSTPEFDPNDILVLKAIRDKAPVNSPLKTLWTDESLIGSWAGVTWDDSSPKKTLKLVFPEYANLTNLDVTGLNNLQYLECLNNQLVSLKVSGLAKLEELYCAYNKLTSLNLSNLINLKILYCAENLITSLDISGLENLEGIDCESNQIASLDFSGLMKIQKCYCSGNLLTSLKISGLSNLKELACDQNQLTSLDVSGLVYLEKIYCVENMLESLNLSGLTNLQSLSCDFNPLSKLDLSGLTNLVKLTCTNCQLTSLDISGLVNLGTLVILANNIPFSKMPLPGSSLSQYYYAPQNNIFNKKGISGGQEIDYSSEALIDGAATTFTWFKDSVVIAGTDQTGKYTPTEAGDYYCEMTNTKFPGLTLTTNNVTVIGVTTEPVLKLVSKLSDAVIQASNVSYQLFLKTNNLYSSEDLTPVIKGDTTFFSVAKGEWIVLAVSNQTPGAFIPTYTGNVVDWRSSESISVSGQESILKEISCVLPDVISNGPGQISGNIYENNGNTTKSVSIVSNVSDNGIPISDALIELFNDGGTIPSLTVFTNNQGYYEFDALKPGNYEIAVEIPGFIQSEKFPVTISDSFPSASIKFGVNTNTQEITDANLLYDLNLKIYPNPSDGRFIIESDQTFNSMEIFNLSGEKIYSKKGNHWGTTHIDLSSQAKGIYLLKIDNGKEAYSAMLLIK